MHFLYQLCLSFENKHNPIIKKIELQFFIPQQIYVTLYFNSNNFFNKKRVTCEFFPCLKCIMIEYIFDVIQWTIINPISYIYGCFLFHSKACINLKTLEYMPYY
jgi:hypothetical protein